MPEARFCPWCAADLLVRLSDGCVGSRVIGTEISRVYDGVLYWVCPDCLGSWHRWPADSPYRAEAEQFAGPPPRMRQAVDAWAEANLPGALERLAEPSKPDDPAEIRRRVEELRAAKSVRPIPSTEGTQ